MKNNLEIENQNDIALQQLTIHRLKNMEAKGKTLSIKLGIGTDDIEDTLNTDEYIQKLSLTELKKVVSNSFTLQAISENTLKHKVQLTGLDSETVLLIENRKEKATLQQLIIYCTKLNIPFKSLLPELYKA